MTTSRRARRLSVGVEAALAFAAGAASFALTSAILVADGSDVLAAVIAALAAIVVLAISRGAGAAYALPVAVAVVLSFDWYLVPPTHPHGFPGAADLGYLLAFLGGGVLLGDLIARAGRRAETSESARSELAGEQAALRRVATLVASGEQPSAVFAVVAEEVGVMLGVDGARVVRFLGDDEILQLEGWTAAGLEPLPVGPLKLEGTSLSTEVKRTERSVRIDDYASVNRVVPWFARKLEMRGGVAAPIFVGGHLWGAMLAWSLEPRRLPADAERRLGDFTELVGMAISNTAGREEIALLAREQEALRRVATLVAHGVPPPELFEAVAREVGMLLGVDTSDLVRYEPEGGAMLLGSWRSDGPRLPVKPLPTLVPRGILALVRERGCSARVDDYDELPANSAAEARRLGMRSGVGAPIIIDGELWGAIAATSSDREPLGPSAESKMVAFTELVATAISNAEARAEAGRLGEEQAALRRVATLVARGCSPNEVFAQVAEEVGLLVGVESAWMQRYTAEGNGTLVAMWGELTPDFPIGMHLALEGESVTARVRDTWRPARIDDFSETASVLGGYAREAGARSAVGCPIVVDGELWGSITAIKSGAEALPPGAESRIADFTELVATAISNVQARAELARSRARIVAASEEERRRVVRDLHDGAQQRLVHTVLTLKMARRALEKDAAEAPTLLSEAQQHAEQATAELRELVHGILPLVLTSGGLRAGVVALASRCPVPVEIHVAVDRLPGAIEATAYFLAAEALTNVAKHARATRAEVRARIDDGTLEVEVCDDGVGGARLDGSGLTGLADRLDVIEGSLRVDSPPGGGTVVAAVIPIQQQSAAASGSSPERDVR
ncbi:MAG: sensor histidine kinase [Solirubrobacterales bacterium]